MFTNNDTPTGLTSLVVSDIRNTVGFSLGADGQPVSAVAEFRSTTGGVLLPAMTSVQMGELNPAPGLMIFDTTIGDFRTYDGADWTIPSAGDIVGPGGATVINNIVTWAANDGLAVKDSGVGIAQVPPPLESLSVLGLESLVTGYKIDNLNYINFVNSVGSILVEGFFAVQHILNNGSSVEQVATIINGSLLPSGGSSSVSAILEIQSTTGALLLSRMTTAQMNALEFPKPGMLLHNLDTGKTVLREGTDWVDVISSGLLTLNGAVTGSGSGTITTTLNTTVECQSNTQIFDYSPLVDDFFIFGIHNNANLTTIFQINAGAQPKLWLGYNAAVNPQVGYIETHGLDFEIVNNGTQRFYIENGTGKTSIDNVGNWTFPNKQLKNIADPSANQDAVNKQYMLANPPLITLAGAVQSSASSGTINNTLAQTVECQASAGPILVQKFHFAAIGIAIFNIDSADSSTPTVVSLTSGGDPLGPNAVFLAYSQDSNFCQFDVGTCDLHISDNGGNDRLVILNSSGGTGGAITIDADGNMIFP